jgi:hypothetical protein
MNSTIFFTTKNKSFYLYDLTNKCLLKSHPFIEEISILILKIQHLLKNQYCNLYQISMNLNTTFLDKIYIILFVKPADTGV